MPRALLILVLLAAGVSDAFTQVAQSKPPEPTAEQLQDETDKQIERWTRILGRIGDQLDEPDLSLPLLGQLETTVEEVRTALVAARDPIRAKVDEIRALAQALGPPPNEGEPPEAENVAAQRADLNRRLALPEGQLKKIDVLVQLTGSQLTQIANSQRRALTAQLLVRTPSPLSSETWANAASEFVALGSRILASPREWYESPQVGQTVGTSYFVGLLLAVLATAVLGWYLRRWLILRFGRKPEIEEPSYRMRVLAALAEGTANTAIPTLVVTVAYLALLSRGLLFGVFQHLVLGIVVAVIVFSVLRGLPRAMLSPSLHHWRLVHLGDKAARLWYRRALTLAVIVGIDTLLIVPGRSLDPSLTLSLYDFLVGLALSTVFLAAAVDKRLWWTPEEEARALAIKAGAPPGPPLDSSVRRSRWWLAGRVLLGAIALAIPLTALAGYGVLADHMTRRMLASAGVLLIVLVLHGLARDLVAVLTREDEKPPGPDETAGPLYVWTVLLLDIALVVTVAVFLVPLWGGRWDNILERVGWAMSGIQIGGRTFSPIDLLAGILVFVFLVVLVRFVQRFLDRRILQQTRMDVGVRNAVNTGIGYVGFLLAALVAIDTAGIDLSGLAIIAGALSVGIGFGMQSIVNNFVSGLILLVERPIKVGDWIVVGPDQGTVKRISVRSTQIQTFSNASVIIPNAELISGRVTNWMYKDRSGRVELPIGVAYGSDTEKVREILVKCAKAHRDVNLLPEPYVMFMDFGDSALLFQLRYFVRDMNNALSSASDLRFAIDAAFREAGITIPFPQRDVHVIQNGGASTGEEAEPGKTARAPSGKVLPIRGSKRTEEIEADSGGET